MPPYSFWEKPNENNKENLADIDLCSQYKEEITEDTTRCQSQQIKYGSGRSQLTEQVIEYCQQYNYKQPDAQQKDRENKRHLER